MESIILKFIDKYDVDIELKYKKNSIVAIIENDDSITVIKCGFINNLTEEIEKVCKIIHKNKIDKYNELNERLNKLDKDIFPDKLF